MMPHLAVYLLLALTAMSGHTAETFELMREDADCSAEPIYHCQSGNGDSSLVFVHGWGGSHWFWHHQLDYFSRNHRVILVDLPGHGRSPPGAEPLSLQTLTSGLERLFEALKVKNAILVGHDMGALVALATVGGATSKPRFRALIAVESLVATHLVLPQQQQRQILKRLRKDFSRTAAQLTRDLFSPAADPALIESVSQQVASMDPIQAFSLMDDLFETDFSLALKRFDRPVIILNSRFNPPRLEQLQKHNPGVNSVAVDWDEHFAFLEQPSLFNTHLERVLTRWR